VTSPGFKKCPGSLKLVCTFLLSAWKNVTLPPRFTIYYFRLLDYSLLNAHVLYKVKTGENISLAQFHLTLVKQIVEKYFKEAPRTSNKRGLDGDNPVRLVARYFPSRLPKQQNGKQI
jgi:hypothetical protein